MVSRNENSMMKLVRLPILRPLLLKCGILIRFESLKTLKDLYGCQVLSPSHTNPLNFFKFSNYLKFPRLSIIINLEWIKKILRCKDELYLH